jgi:hypothetical protein
LRRAIRSITFAHFVRFGGSATIPLAENVLIFPDLFFLLYKTLLCHFFAKNTYNCN